MSKVLVVDDDTINRMILEGMLIKGGHEVVQAADGQLAIDSYIKEKPDLVLMDIMMPVMNGYDATRRIKELAGDKFIPIIVLTAMTDESELIKCVNSGADDFLTKPFSHAILTAKMFALTRTQELYQTISLQRDQIEKNRQLLHEEQEQAAKIYKRMTDKDEIEDLSLHTHMSPMSVFNGDMLLTAQTPDKTTYIFLTDATGHGLPAAIGAFPVRDIFSTMVNKGCSVFTILGELNRKLVDILPVEFFLCGVMLVISPDKSQYSIWNGGLPDVIVYRPASRQIIQKVSSANLPLGIAATDSYEAELVELDVRAGDSIIIYSDGATEAQGRDGGYFGQERFLNAIINSESNQVVDTILNAISEFCGDNSQTDDVSLLEYTVTNPS
ncbi:MAG: SpoIIE family protein phosphatase [Gammaproteobacteria bacterium]|nr:SpoIIE family protein phosphatase [Gammaproteobacteria bacterium]